MNVLSSAEYPNKGLIWYENIDGQGKFNSTNQHIISDINSQKEVFVSDIDGDGDMDVLSFSWNGVLEWHENLGN